MSILVSKDLIRVEMEYVDLNDNNVNMIVVVSTDAEKKILKEKGIDIKKVKAGFSRPNWGSFSTYMRDVVTRDPVSGELMMDNAVFRQNKLKTLLEELFQIEVENGKRVEEPIEIDIDFFNRCNTDFAVGLVEKFDEVLEKERTSVLKKYGLLDKNGNTIDLSSVSEEKKEFEKDEEK